MVDSGIEVMFVIKEAQLTALTTLLTEYEVNGDLIEGLYQIMQLFIKVSKDETSSANVAVLDQSRNLLCQAIKHSAVYQCGEAFHFLQLLIQRSEKFKNKSDMVMALQKIVPPSLKEKEKLLGQPSEQA